MMRLLRIAAFLAFAGTGLFASGARAEITPEATLQYALENLVSGTAATARIGDTEISVTPLRTWKSVSGHWCRRFEMTVSQSGAATERNEATRCRDSDGTWKTVEE
jgi:surface antigen